MYEHKFELCSTLSYGTAHTQCCTQLCCTRIHSQVNKLRHTCVTHKKTKSNYESLSASEVLVNKLYIAMYVCMYSYIY